MLFATLPSIGSSDDVQFQQLVSGCRASLRGMKVIDQNNVIATGSNSTAILTQDGGRSWVRLNVAELSELDFRDIETTGDGSLILMSTGPAEKSQIFRSEDMGQSWNVVHRNQESQGFFNGMAFTVDGFGLLVGDPIDGQLFLLNTSDFGKSWKRMPGPKLLDGEYGFAASGTGIVLGDEGQAWITTGAAAARVFNTTNHGQSWNVATTPIRTGEVSEGIFSIAFHGTSNGVIVGGDYKQPEIATANCAVTSNGGRDWSLAKVQMPHKACVRFMDSKRVLAVGRTGVMLSTDRGANWHTVSESNGTAAKFVWDLRSVRARVDRDKNFFVIAPR